MFKAAKSTSNPPSRECWLSWSGTDTFGDRAHLGSDTIKGWNSFSSLWHWTRRSTGRLHPTSSRKMITQRRGPAWPHSWAKAACFRLYYQEKASAPIAVRSETEGRESLAASRRWRAVAGCVCKGLWWYMITVCSLQTALKSNRLKWKVSIFWTERSRASIVERTPRV